MTEWLRIKSSVFRYEMGVVHKTRVKKPSLDDDFSAISRVQSFLDNIPQLVRALAAFRCKSYARALMHYELHFRAERKYKSDLELQPIYSHLQKIYSHLDEVDGLEGIATKFIKPSLDEKILEHESCGMWTAAQTCNELALQRNPNELKYHLGLLNCLKNLNHLGIIY